MLKELDYLVGDLDDSVEIFILEMVEYLVVSNSNELVDGCRLVHRFRYSYQYLIAPFEVGGEFVEVSMMA